MKYLRSGMHCALPDSQWHVQGSEKVMHYLMKERYAVQDKLMKYI